MVTTLLTMGQARLLLVGNELQIEKHRALQQLARALLAVFCIAMAVALAAGLLLVVMWDQRVAVLCTLVVLFLCIAAWLATSLKKEAATQEHPFAASLAELQEDLRQLKAAGDGAQQQSR